jgi:DNA-3-methyladenine glycosylase II
MRDRAVRSRRGGETGDADDPAGRIVAVDPGTGPFSLVDTCGPVAWGGGRWPNVDWLDGSLIWCGGGGERVVWRRVWQRDGETLTVEGDAEASRDAAWADRVLGVSLAWSPFRDPTVEGLRRRFPGLRAFAYGSLYDGLVTAIVGQSISLAAAAVTETRLARLFRSGRAVGGRAFWPLPRATELGDASPALIRTSGVTWRRAEALVAIGRAATTGALPDDAGARREAEAAIEACRGLPLVESWTAAAALLWGVAAPDIYPSGDAALLRAARRAYGQTTLSRPDIDRLAKGWRPERAGAARLLWAGLFGGG